MCVRRSRLLPASQNALVEQAAAIRAVLAETEAPIAAAALARRFAQGKRAERKVDDVLRTLTLLGQAERADGGYILSH